MLKSLEIVNKGLAILNDKILSLNKILAFINKDDILLNDYKEELEHYKKQQDDFKQIKQDLEVLGLIIKWKDMIHFKPNPEFLNDEEYNIMVSELNLIENYVKHHFGGYLPECFRKVGDNHD